MVIVIMADLDFLKKTNNIYYTGLDYRAFPNDDKHKKIYISQSMHLCYLKILSLLVDHVIVPPTFIVSGMSQNDKDEKFIRALMDFFLSKSFITSVYGSMNSASDFVEHKLHYGDHEEKSLFNSRKHEAKTFFNNIPLIKRNVENQSKGFKQGIIENIYLISESILPKEIKGKIENRLNFIEAQGEIALDRMTFINILENLGLKDNRRQYIACYYAMNSSYYFSGAEIYSSDIACLSVEEYSVLGTTKFHGNNDHKIIIGYDPSLFYMVLKCHGITTEEIAALTVEEIDHLKKDHRFIAFLEQYHEFANILQKTASETNRWSKKQISDFKLLLLLEIEKRFHTEEKRLMKWITNEDIGSGFLFSLIGAVLGFGAAGPFGAIAGSGLGFVGPLTKIGRFSLADIIAKKISTKQFAFYLYIEFLNEELGKCLIPTSE